MFSSDSATEKKIPAHKTSLNPKPFLAGLMGDLVSRLIMGMTRVVIWVMKVINLLPKSP